MLKNRIAPIATAAMMIAIAGCNPIKDVKGAQTAGGSFLSALKSHQYAAAYLMCSGSCRSATTQAKMVDYWKLVEKYHGNVNSWKSTGFNMNYNTSGNGAALSYSLQCQKGSSAAGLNMIEENGKWKVQGFNFQA